MITNEQVVDLQTGDIVELTDTRWPNGTVIRGALWMDAGVRALCVGSQILCYDDGSSPQPDIRMLAVISRVPRRLYTNLDRAEPVPGDVVRDADALTPQTWAACRDAADRLMWRNTAGGHLLFRTSLPTRLRLLVDGSTGQVVL